MAAMADPRSRLVGNSRRGGEQEQEHNERERFHERSPSASTAIETAEGAHLLGDRYVPVDVAGCIQRGQRVRRRGVPAGVRALPRSLRHEAMPRCPLRSGQVWATKNRAARLRDSWGWEVVGGWHSPQRLWYGEPPARYHVGPDGSIGSSGRLSRQGSRYVTSMRPLMRTFVSASATCAGARGHRWGRPFWGVGPSCGFTRCYSVASRRASTAHRLPRVSRNSSARDYGPLFTSRPMRLSSMVISSERSHPMEVYRSPWTSNL